MISMVLFDLGDVLELCDDAEWPQAWLAHWAPRFGLTTDEALERLAGADIPDTSISTGTELAYRAAFGRALGLTQEQNDLMFADMWDRYCGEPNIELFDYVRRLHGSVGLGILSNSGDGARREEERRYGLSRLFDPIFYSHEIGAEKPDPAIFEYVVAQLGLPAEQIAFVDNLELNVRAASECGLIGVRHTDNATTMARLDALLGR